MVIAISFHFCFNTNPHSFAPFYTGSLPMETIAVDRISSNVAHSNDDCAEASMSAAGSVDNGDACLSTAASMPPLKRIFDCEKLIRGVNTNGPYWECKHCNNIYAGINATKALCHVLKIKGTQNVAACKEEIPLIYLQRYEDLYSWQHRGKEAKAEAIVARSNKNAARQEKIMASSKPLRKNSLSPTPPPLSKTSRSLTPASISNSALTSSTKRGASMWTKKSPRKKQSYLHTDHPDPQSQNRLDVSIADFIIFNSLPFNLTR